MLSKQLIKKYSSLRQKKFRQEYGLFTAEGEKIVNELLKESGFFRLRSLLATPEYLDKYQIKLKIPEVYTVSQKDLDRISSLKNSNGAILILEIPNYNWNTEEIFNTFSYFFENIQDPGNLGTIIRTCDWFGIRNIFLSPESVDVYNPKVIQASMGSFTRVKIHYCSAVEIFSHPDISAPGFAALATVLDGDSIYETISANRGIVFFGNESKGLSRNIIKHCTHRISIPRNPGNKMADSLNLSIATGIISSELLRKGIIQSEN